MSAIASLRLVSRSGILELARLAHTSPSSLDAYLAEHGREASQGYGWSGYCMLHVLTYLQARGVDLEGSEFDAESAAINEVYGLSLLIPPADEETLSQLDPARHSERELAAHFEVMGFGFEESGTAGLDGLKLLNDSIAQLRADEVLLVHIG